MHPLHGWNFKVQFWGLPLIIPGHKLILSLLVCVLKCSCVCVCVCVCVCLTFTMLFVSPCESQDFIRSWGLARPPGAQEFQDPFPFLSKMPSYLLCLQAGRVSGQCPGQKQVRGLLSSFWKLNKTSSILISLPGTWKQSSNFSAESETVSFSRKARFQPDIIF